MHSEEDKLSAEDKKRRLKTPSQVAALEEFYNGMDGNSIIFYMYSGIHYCQIT